jgi:hypothetical protein
VESVLRRPWLRIDSAGMAPVNVGGVLEGVEALDHAFVDGGAQPAAEGVWHIGGCSIGLFHRVPARYADVAAVHDSSKAHRLRVHFGLTEGWWRARA